MRTIFLLFIAAGCGGSNNGTDASPPPVIDAASVALDCNSYCTKIQANCTNANAQYSDAEHCMAACSTFTIGTSTVNDTTGNTLGCRVHFAAQASNAAVAANDCAYAGPAGDLASAATPAFCSGGDVCAGFCAIDIQACGSVDSPLPGNPTDSNHNPLSQYQNMDKCVVVCDRYDKTHAYSTASRGDSFACRLFQATQATAAADRSTACPDTGNPAASPGPCTGTASPP
jgi:hypothetical protein